MINAVLSYDNDPAELAARRHDKENPTHFIEVTGGGFKWMCRNCPAEWSVEENKTIMRGSISDEDL